MDIRNYSILPQHYTASQLRRPRLGAIAWIISEYVLVHKNVGKFLTC